MYNRHYKYLTDKKILHPQQPSFRKCHSTEHTVGQLPEQIYELLERANCTIGIFVDFSKAFDSVNHPILLKKIEICRVKGANLHLFRKQYIHINNDNMTN